jgi:outer membrane lipase/esterase
MVKTFRKALVAASVAAACWTGSANAQWSGFYFFGDSLTDAGSYIPVVPVGGRFTTNPGEVWAQVLGSRYGFVITPANQGGTDYAYGGARVTLLPGYPNSPPMATAVPIATQISQHLASGIDPGGLYAVWGGANDVFHQLDQFRAGQITSEQAQAAVATAAAQLAARVAALQAAGAGTIVVINLPDIGRTPAGQAGGPAVAAQISAITGLYNSTLTAALSAAGIPALRVDIFSLFNEFLANPAAYGIANVTTPACGATPSLQCTPANLVAPNAASTFLFADPAHPTTAGHALIASAVASMLEGPQQAATLAEGPLAVEQSTFRTLDGRMWSQLDTPIAQKGTNLWVSVDYANPDIDFGLVSGDADLWTFSFGGDIRITDHLLAGAAVNYSEYKADYTGANHKLEELSGTVYAGYGHGPWYVGASLLIGDLDYKDVRRSFDLGALQRVESGRTSGTHWAMRVLGGYWFKAGGVLHGPFAKLVYQEAAVNAFSEDGASSTALRYGEQKRESLLASVGWQAQGQWGAVRPFGRVTWEYDFKNDARSIEADSASLGGQYSITLRKPDDNWALFHVGASMDIGAGTPASGRPAAFVMGTGTAGKDDGDSYAITVGVRFPL